MGLLAPQPISLPYRELPGAVSCRALEEHYKLYLNYREMVERVDAGLCQAERPSKHVAESPYSGLLWGQSYALAGAYLHELYFLNLTPFTNRIQILLRVEAVIEKKWGSCENFWQDLRSAAMQSRGWVVLAVCHECPDDLRIFALDAHDMGAVYGYCPLLVLDVYEHAWWMDHGTNRGAYLDAVCGYIDWMTVEDRYNKAHPAPNLYGR